LNLETSAHLEERAYIVCKSITCPRRARRRFALAGWTAADGAGPRV